MSESKKVNKHLPMIEAWLAGQQIQYKTKSDPGWYNIKDPSWSSDVEYRVRPLKKYEPDNAELILAWAHGAIIQEDVLGRNEWSDVEWPDWADTHGKYRVKPEEIIQEMTIHIPDGPTNRVNFSFDSKTKQLIKVEIVK